MKINTLFLLLFLNQFAFAQSKKEKQILRSVDSRNHAAIELLKKVVEINSGTMNFEGVKKVGDIFNKELKALGFETHWAPGDAFNRAGHLIAIHNGNKTPRILLIGHLDTVFEKESPFQTFTMVNDSIMHGPGASDMKGGDVIIVLAMQALHDAGLLNDLSIEIVMSGDEESGGRPLSLSRKDLIEAGNRCDIALGYEDGDGLATTAVVARRGSSDWTVTVKGKEAHSSQLFTVNVGAGAIYDASRILKQFYDSLSKEENLTVNPGIIIGGNKISYDEAIHTGTAFGKNNIVSQDVFIKGDIRAVSTEQFTRTKKMMMDIVAANYPLTIANIDFGDGYPPMTLRDGNKKLLGYYSDVSTELGFTSQTAVNPRYAGAADISFVNDKVKMALDGLGLPGADGHTTNETANLNYLSVEGKRSAILIYRLSTGIYK